jgi:hypothetical protein
MERLELELRRVQMESQAQLQEAEARIEILKRQMEKTRQMVEKGLATPEAQAALEAQLASAKQQMAKAMSELQVRQSDIGLRRREAEARAEFERQMLALDAAKMASEARDVTAIRDRQATAEAMEAAVAAVREARQVDVDRAAVVAELEKQVAAARAAREVDPEQMRRLEEQMRAAVATADRAAAIGAAVAVGAGEPARIGDILALTIAGEPGLPGRYTVQGDGTIRIPFVGGIRVQGMTADQIREAVARELTGRNLKSNPDVTVTIRRPGR